jgi:hypothetical protein
MAGKRGEEIFGLREDFPESERPSFPVAFGVTGFSESV